MSSTFNEDRFRRSLSYSTSATPSDVLHDIRLIRRIDAEAEHKNHFWTLAIAGSVFAMITGFLLIVGGLSTFGVVIGITGLIVLITGISRKFVHKRMDVDNRRYELAAELLRYLSKDMAPDAVVDMAIDFRAHNHKNKLDRSGKTGLWNTKFFVDPWMTLTGRLLDGTKFSITMIQKHQDRHRTKRSASGKTKHKYKTKASSEAVVTLRIKPHRYPDVATLSGTVQSASIRLPPGIRVKAFDAQNESLTLRTTTTSDWNVYPRDQREKNNDGVQWIAMKLMFLYGLLITARKAQNSQ